MSNAPFRLKPIPLAPRKKFFATLSPDLFEVEISTRVVDYESPTARFAETFDGSLVFVDSWTGLTESAPMSINHPVNTCDRDTACCVPTDASRREAFFPYMPPHTRRLG